LDCSSDALLSLAVVPLPTIESAESANYPKEQSEGDKGGHLVELSKRVAGVTPWAILVALETPIPPDPKMRVATVDKITSTVSERLRQGDVLREGALLNVLILLGKWDILDFSSLIEKRNFCSTWRKDSGSILRAFGTRKKIKGAKFGLPRGTSVPICKIHHGGKPRKPEGDVVTP
jgi:hypothetical protein